MSKKILIVDDDPDFLFILNHILKREGHEVISAQKGMEGLEKVRTEKPDMVFLDIMMPDVDGWEVCRRIKTANPTIVVSMCSVLRDPEYIEKSIRFAGADEHITKPLSFNKVLVTVNGLRPESDIHGETLQTEE